MRVFINIVKPNAINHRTLMVGRAIPSWWEIIFLFRWYNRVVAFVGKGSKWYTHPEETPVSDSLARQLTKRENYFKIYNH